MHEPLTSEYRWMPFYLVGNFSTFFERMEIPSLVIHVYRQKSLQLETYNYAPEYCCAYFW
jgi:hypothetical protein